MTARELLGLTFRRWYLVLFGAILSAGALYLTTHQPGVYSTQFNVVVLAPTEQYYRNQIEDPRHSLAPMAGVVATDWNDNHPPMFTASGDTTLVGQGQRRGVQVRVPNEGSQWQPAYYSPTINVQVVDATPEAVSQTAGRIRGELAALLLQRQEAAGIRPAMRMTMLAAPDVPTVDYVAGSQTRAALATALAGAVSTVLAVYVFERRVARRRKKETVGDRSWQVPPLPANVGS